MTKQSNDEKTSADPTLVECILDGARGIYLPQDFAEMYSPEDWNCEEVTDAWDILLEGPDNELYWEAWDEVLSTAFVIRKDGRWTLFQDMDLFIVHDDYCI